MEHQNGCQIKALQSNNGTEFTSKAFIGFLKQHGVITLLSQPQKGIFLDAAKTNTDSQKHAVVAPTTLETETSRQQTPSPVTFSSKSATATTSTLPNQIERQIWMIEEAPQDFASTWATISSPRNVLNRKKSVALVQKLNFGNCNYRNKSNVHPIIAQRTPDPSTNHSYHLL
ncbi:hypothetical protein PIB30_022372 [Stylosanthes scabra]|uniref:Integrase catalytic domain-containing protein n=1 Tax=Stylosanthes scabra TaxID=79078 RepID=A0ABU6X6K3_9FABA|nr:hypothetical protein [Stylosanthes scabra]